MYRGPCSLSLTSDSSFILLKTFPLSLVSLSLSILHYVSRLVPIFNTFSCFPALLLLWSEVSPYELMAWMTGTNLTPRSICEERKCVCVRERGREREKEYVWEREREREEMVKMSFPKNKNLSFWTPSPSLSPLLSYQSQEEDDQRGFPWQHQGS